MTLGSTDLPETGSNHTTEEDTAFDCLHRAITFSVNILDRVKHLLPMLLSFLYHSDFTWWMGSGVPSVLF